jgi:hypothetical protein
MCDLAGIDADSVLLFRDRCYSKARTLSVEYQRPSAPRKNT